MSAKVKRLILTNIPYLIVFLLFCKLGEGWRLAAGVDVGTKLLHFLELFKLALQIFIISDLFGKEQLKKTRF